MKRWQDRGEVLDSDDDEELGLEAESPARKKARVEVSSAAGITDGESLLPRASEGGKDAGEEDWLQPKVANTYGRRGRPTKLRLETQQTQNATSLRATLSSPEAQPPKDQGPQDSPASNPGQEINYRNSLSHSLADKDLDIAARNGSTTSSPTAASATLSGLVSSQTMLVEQDHTPDPEAQSSASKNLPDVRDVLAGGDATNARGRQDVGGYLSSGLSSPLSERSISPPAPEPTFRFPRRGSDASAVGAEPPNAGQEQSEMSATPTEVLEAIQSGRRTFRARKAQQLHPYEYEKLQYQKQFHERGLRTVRVVNPGRNTVEAQNASSSDNEQDSWQPSQQMRSSPARPSSGIGEHNHAPFGSDSDEELPDIATLGSRRIAVAVVQHGAKRQKLSHHQAESTRPITAGSRPADEFSVPPSPPPTSSESNDNRAAASKFAVFRFPRGMTPNRHTQQPTPTVSSDIRHAQIDSEEDVPRKSRLSTVSRPRHAPIPIDSSTEFSASDSEPHDDPEVRRLLKERKRIRGVLPASWLKIDLKAQQRRASPSPAKRRQPATQSPERAQPQKGVAQRVQPRASASSTQPAPIPISDDESDNDLSTYLSQSKKRQSRLHFDREGTSAAPTDFVEDERMEVDYVDAMLAGSSRPKSHSAATKRRQPRITAAFTTGRNERSDFEEERRAARRAGGTSPGRAKGRRRHRGRQTAPKPSVPRLSIVDAPAPGTPSSQAVPQFVKLAMRRARTQEDSGRHSPSEKHIRLATERDTEDATSVLQAWRDGTVAPRQQTARSGQHRSGDPIPRGSHPTRTGPLGQQRLPLAELSGNHNSRLPKALRTTAAKQQAGARKLDLSRRTMHQSRLEPVSLDDDTSPAQANPNHEDSLKATSTGDQRPRVKPRPRMPQPRYRGAQVESLESDFDLGQRAAAFERRMHVLTENVVRGRSQHRPAAPVQLERFLYDPDTEPREPVTHHHQPSRIQGERQGEGQQQQPHKPPMSRQPLPHRPRKRAPQRMDAEARQYRQPSEPLPDTVDLEAEQVTSQQHPHERQTLQGLGPFGTRYAVDFDTLPLPLGTYFHESSFIGSDDFAASLTFTGRNLDVPTGRIRIHVGVEVLNLGIWNEEVAAGLASIPSAVSDALQSLSKDVELQGSQDSPAVVMANVDYLLRSAVRYFTRCLAFSDPIDRRACVQSLQRFVEDIFEAAAEHDTVEDEGIQSRCLQYALVLARQAVSLCGHPTIPQDLARVCQELLLKATSRLASNLVHAHLGRLRSFYEDIRRAAKREAGVRDSDTSICSVTILYHVLKSSEHTGFSFWSVLYDAMDVHTERLASVRAFDRGWSQLFAILPALEIDSHGILRMGSRFEDAKEDWSTCKALIERLFHLYPASSTLPASTINDYVRATLIRCSRLQSRWGWLRCEPTLYSISDFFARRGLAQLHKEEYRGSPSFLQELDQQPSLEVHADDRSFHIFLKMLASGLRNMSDRGVYSDKKIGGIAWRFIPNHGRTHRKDVGVRQEDLDALRNHHDLLCTIYYASPPNNRLRVDLIQNLVDHTASHREACRLNVRAWRNLAAFQASTSESVERLESFNVWFRELLAANVMQFRLARTEVEQDAASAAANGGALVSQDMIESVIAANQRQIAATITDALAAVKHTLKSASSLNATSTVVEGTAFWLVFDLFDPGSRKLFGMFEEALEVIKTALEIQRKFQSEEGSQLGSDDSQDYGDSSALQELASTQMPRQPSRHDIAEIVHNPLAGFLSSVFGADGMSHDGLLAKVVDVWVQLASVQVSQGKKTWQDYISGYGSEAWSQLRDTEQRKKYTPYFLANVAETSKVDLVETGILAFWLKALVEREATLKFQHTLTNAMLNGQHDEPLLANLPFIRPRHGNFAVSLHELRQRRLGLISSVLSNMHQHFDDTMSFRPARLPELRRTYADMLRQMMQAMKANYQEVQGSGQDASADPQAQGEYVGFVQQVVSFLQQYTTDICPIDRFFTDSSAFPLPATDPTYVVGRLKGYVPKLSESRKRKELAVFVQTVSERAAVDSQQSYLVDQLTAAMTGVLERGNSRVPSLRHVLMTAVFPAYIENALSTACSWILALPFLEACGRIIADLLYSAEIEDEHSLQAAIETIAIPVRCMLRVVETALIYPGQLMFAHVLATLRTIFETMQQSLTVMHHLGRASKDTYLGLLSSHFSQCALATMDLLAGREYVDLPETIIDNPATQSQWPDTRDFAKKHFQDNLKGWHAQDGQYYMRRGANSVQVVRHLDDAAEEKARLMEALQRYQQSYKTVFEGRSRGRDGKIDLTEAVIV